MPCYLESETRRDEKEPAVSSLYHSAMKQHTQVAVGATSPGWGPCLNNAFMDFFKKFLLTSPLFLSHVYLLVCVFPVRDAAAAPVQPLYCR